MLARLDGIEGVEESRVDRSGRHLLIRVAPGGDGDRVARDVGSVLGAGARRLAGEAADARVEGWRRGEPWMRAGETLRLSREEARVLARRRAREAAAAAGLDEGRRARLAALLDEEIAAAFERIHASGKPPEARFRAEWDAVLERVRARARDLLDADEAARVFERLREPF